ncbi:DUF2971 domain-containing protein [Shewanella woodyi]|uniref:DUF2971 domain-containing protein n=1 Tax=Shewanella woodyi (strain ATCC 51908 / MS32) TaxID=392500 RepID=B1KG26_SHEWM|nr:DUF2971 domain-containing protein [Shewanella woodyi]ACA86733.1 conserved hypothetical protein [Shewanella woodyi ATCC 51908]
MRLYKYRGFENLEFALDIFINQRLFAADFKSLNDPMEGRYIYSKGMLSKEEISRIRGRKSEFKILSLSETAVNMLMWSYYCEGHKGFAVGVEVLDQGVSIEPVTYVDDLKLDKEEGGDIAKAILTKKLKLWSHEREHRVFAQGSPFVAVKVKELVFGINTESRQSELLTAIAKKFCPGITIRQLVRTDIETGELDEYEI